jgi:undecaprenyl-diphosphatase
MGIMEGLTEFIPVSSTGHLILLGSVLRIPEQIQHSFDVAIQFGAILAVVVRYPERWAALVRPGRSAWGGAHAWKLLAWVTLPASIVGAALHGWILRHAFKPPAVAIGLALGAIGMLVLERCRGTAIRARSLDDLTPIQAFWIGCFQCIALWPGVSRSAATILGGMACGLPRHVAAEFSFLAAVPLLMAASVFALVRNAATIGREWIAYYLIGLATAFVFGWLAIGFLVRFLQRHRMDIFAWYRMVLAAVVLWWSR